MQPEWRSWVGRVGSWLAGVAGGQQRRRRAPDSTDTSPCLTMDQQHAPISEKDEVRNQQVAAVLALVPQHAGASLDAKGLCSLLQLSTACRAAMQRSVGRCSITISVTASEAALTGFAAWLPKHAGLVGRLEVQRPHTRPEAHVAKKDPSPRSRTAGAAAIAAALRGCVAPGGLSAFNAGHQQATAEGAAGPAGASLRLESFTAGELEAFALVGVLPATSQLTHLDLTATHRLSEHGGSDPRDLTPAIQQLSGLRQLRLRSYRSLDSTFCEDDAIFPWPWHVNVTTGLASLSLLTRLDIGRLYSYSDLGGLPHGLRELRLQVVVGMRYEDQPWVCDDPDEDVLENGGIFTMDTGPGTVYGTRLETARRLDLRYLRQLRRCEVMQCVPAEELDERGVISATLHLAAPQLTRLQLHGEFGDVAGLDTPCQVEQLEVSGCDISTTRLCDLLAGMPRLRDFRFDNYNADFSDNMISTTPAEEARLAAALGAATRLTALCIAGLRVACQQPGDEGGEGSSPSSCAQWGHHLQGLVRLQHLGADWLLRDADVHQLSTLTALTYLSVG